MYFKKTLKNGNLHSNGFQSFYNLQGYKTIDVKNFTGMHAVEILIFLAKYSTFFGKKINLEDCRYLINDENALFIGALIGKIMEIIFSCGNEVKKII